MDLDFAILLMRTSYAVADELDFMPMNEFQRDMFLLRQNEWDTYKDKLPVKQGDLADPLLRAWRKSGRNPIKPRGPSTTASP